jgi:hypothetical protein
MEEIEDTVGKNDTASARVDAFGQRRHLMARQT